LNNLLYILVFTAGFALFDYFSDGGRTYNLAKILEVKEYIVCDLLKTEVVDNEVEVVYEDRVWLPLDTTVFSLTPEEIELIQNPPEIELNT